MAGGTLEHAEIAANLISELKARFKGGPCKALGSDLRVRITDTINYCYPDVTVVCGPPAFDPPDKRITITNPQVIFEVSSASTFYDDRRAKFYDYISIDSLQEYILVDQDRARVDTFYRHPDGIWAIGPSSDGLAASLKLRSLDITIPLADIYAGVELPQTPPEPAKST